MVSQEKLDELVKELFTTGSMQEVDRLVCVDVRRKDLGGYSREAVRQLFSRILNPGVE